MFVDVTEITVSGGRGGDGSVSFHREKYIAAGGPDGGDGGRGGSVYAVVDQHMTTLMDFRFKHKFKAGDGAPGTGKGSSGKKGEDITIRLPRGTLIRDKESGALMHDLSDDEPFCLAQGGRGGWGNRRFATSTRQTPRFAKPGMPGESRTLILELKLLADVGLVGLPNAGKSTLLSMVSAARPKIAGYPFTTLTPNMGVVRVDHDTSFVVADIPGLIEGAAEGAGLGIDFLRHVERCRLLLHVVDVSGSEGRDPVQDVDVILKELEAFSPELAARPQIIAANKCDLLTTPEVLEGFVKEMEARGFACYPISGATRAGVDALTAAVAERLSHLPPILRFEEEFIPAPPEALDPKDLVYRQDGDVWVVEGAWLENLIRHINFGDYESRMYLDRMLRDGGVFDRLKAMGVQEGDTVSLLNMEFEYVD